MWYHGVQLPEDVLGCGHRHVRASAHSFRGDRWSASVDVRRAVGDADRDREWRDNPLRLPVDSRQLDVAEHHRERARNAHGDGDRSERLLGE
jgi:hypothetical protein